MVLIHVFPKFINLQTTKKLFLKLFKSHTQIQKIKKQNARLKVGEKTLKISVEHLMTRYFLVWSKNEGIFTVMWDEKQYTVYSSARADIGL